MLDKVSVKYDESQEPVISNVSLHIPPGQKVRLNLNLKYNLVPILILTLKIQGWNLWTNRQWQIIFSDEYFKHGSNS